MTPSLAASRVITTVLREDAAMRRAFAMAWGLPALYLTSGAAALMLEVTWTRLLTLQMGHTTGAASTVLAAFMGGLAIGSAIGGRVAGRVDRRRALTLYALLEVVVAMAAVAMPTALGAFEPLLRMAYGDGSAPVSFGLARVVASLLALAVPTIAMGATFPLATRALATARVDVSGARLYTANTIGAAAGALGAGFVLLPALGMSMTALVAATLNVLAAAGAWGLSNLTDLASSIRPRAWGPELTPLASGLRPLASEKTGVIVAAVLGAVALVNQIAWTRVLALVVGPTTYAFSAMVGMFILGLAIGAAIGTAIVARTRRPAVWLGISVIGIAVAMAAAMQATTPLLLWNAAAAGSPVPFATALWRQLATAATLLLPLSVASGAAFPLALMIAGGGALSPRQLAWTYASNTGGAIVGALGAGYLLIPLLGLQGTLRAAMCVTVATGIGVIASRASSWRTRMATVLGGVVLAGGLSARAGWDPALLSSGGYRFAPDVPPDQLPDVLTAGETLFYREASAGTVAVRRLAGTTSLIIDGKPDASNAGDMLTQKLLAHVPLLLHPAPGTVGVIGLGSGVTVGAALTHPVTRVDAIEIAPAVVEASAFFARENRQPLKDPRTRLVIADARSHLRLSNARYDVLISEPSNPWMAGVAALFTREFMTTAREHLAPGGVFCQWAHTYDMSEADLRSVIATFTHVFPHAALYLVGESDVLLVGSTAALSHDERTLAGRLSRAGVSADLRTVGVTGTRDLESLWIGDADVLRAYASGASLQTDDRLALEFSAPRSLVSRTGRDNVERLMALRSQVSDPGGARWRSRGQMLLQAEAYGLAFASMSRAVDALPTDANALDLLGRAAAGAGRLPDAIAQVRRLAGTDPANVEARIALSRWLMAQGDVQEAMTAIGPAVTSPDADVRALTQLASMLADGGDADGLTGVLAVLTRRAGEAPDTQYFVAALAFLRGDFAAALDGANRLVASGRADARSYNMAGAAAASLGRTDDARRAFAQSVAADPRDTAAYVNGGRLELERGQSASAARLFAAALAIDATSRAALDGLTQAKAAGAS